VPTAVQDAAVPTTTIVPVVAGMVIECDVPDAVKDVPSTANVPVDVNDVAVVPARVLSPATFKTDSELAPSTLKAPDKVLAPETLNDVAVVPARVLSPATFKTDNELVPVTLKVSDKVVAPDTDSVPVEANDEKTPLPGLLDPIVTLSNVPDSTVPRLGIVRPANVVIGKNNRCSPSPAAVPP